MNEKHLLLLSMMLVAACSSTPPCAPRAAEGDIIYIVQEGWHAEIGIPMEELDANLSFYHKTFKDARVILFGYGKKTFITAPPSSFSEYMLGPVPGPAVIQAVGLRVTPLQAYPDDEVIELTLPPGGKEALLDFIWQDLTQDTSGKPQVVAKSHDPEGLFYMAESEYTLFHTCNSWTAEALQHAGFPVSPDHVIFSHQVMKQVRHLAQTQCSLP